MIIEQIIPKFIQDKIYNKISEETFIWHWSKIVPISHLCQMVHRVVDEMPKKPAHECLGIEFLQPIIDKFSEKSGIKIKQVLRVKINQIPKLIVTDDELETVIHVDYEKNAPGKYISMVYYINDSDGDTTIFEDDKKTVVERSSPVKGNCVYFNSKSWHRSTPPKEHDKRMIINFIFLVE